MPSLSLVSRAAFTTATLLGAALAGTAQAATLTYDADANPLNGATDGAGPGWNTSSVVWRTGLGINVAWPNTNIDEAVFGAASGAAGTVTVGTVNANKITFNAPGSGNYILSGGTINLAGTTPTIAVNRSATINSVLAGTDVTVTSSGTAGLTLGGANTFTGTLQLNNGSSIPANWDTPNVQLSSTGSLAATQVIIGSGGSTASNPVIFANNAANQMTSAVVTLNASSGANSYAIWELRGNSQSIVGLQTSGATGNQSIVENSNDSSSYLSNSTLTITGGGAYAYNGVLRNRSSGASGTLGVTMSGSGTQTLTGAGITYTGATTVNGGTLAWTGSTTLAGAVTVNSGGTFSMSGSANLSGGVTVNSGGTFAWDTTVRSTNSGINIGTLDVKSGGTLNLINTTPVNFGATALFNNQVLQGAGTINQSGGGVVDWWTGTNISGFSGAYNVQNGILSIQCSTAAAATTTATVNLAATGSLDLRTQSFGCDQLTGSGTVGSSFSGSYTLTVGTNGGSSTFNGAIKNGGISGGSATIALTKAGSGVFALVGGNITYGGATQVNDGTLELRDTTAFASATTVNAGATLKLNRTALGFASRSAIGANAISLNGGTLSIDNAGSGLAGGWTTVNGGTGSLSGTGTININSGVFSRDNTSANTINTSATVNVAAGAFFGAGRGGNSTIGALNGSGVVSTLWSGGSNAGSITIGNGDGSGTFTGMIAGNGTNGADGTQEGGVLSVVKTGTGTQTFSGANTYSGATTISAGVLNIRSSSALGGVTNGTSVTAGAALELQGGIAVGAEALTLNGTGVSSGGALRNISGANAYGGAITLGSATRINSDAGTLALTGNIGGATQNLTVGGAGITTVSGAIGTTTGTLTKDGSGPLFLSGANTYSGGTTLSGGTLVATGGSSLGTGAVAVDAGTNLSYQASSPSTVLAIGGDLSITGGGTVLGASIGTSATGAQINVAGNATATGAVTVDLYGATGAQPVTGTYTLVHGAGLLSSLNGATWTLGAIVYNNTNFTVNPGTLAATATDLTIGITGQTALTSAYWKGGLAGATNVWAASDGSTTSNWAATAGGGAQALVAGGGTTVHISATTPTTAPTATVLGANMSIAGLVVQDTVNGLGLNADGHSLTIGSGGITVNASVPASTLGANVVVGANQTWTNNSTQALTVSGAVSGGSTLAVAGSGKVVLTGTNTWSNTTTISGGTLQIGSGGTTGTLGTGNVVDNGALVFNRSDNLTVSNAISGSGTLTKTGAGTLTLTGANTYAGVTTVSAGTLSLITNNLASTSGYSLNDAGTGASDTTLQVIGGFSNNRTGLNSIGLRDIAPITVTANGTGTSTLSIDSSSGNWINGLVTINKAVVLKGAGANGVRSGFITISGNGAGAGNDSVIYDATGSGNDNNWNTYEGPGAYVMAPNTYLGNVRFTGGTTIIQNKAYANAAYINMMIPDAASVKIDAGSAVNFAHGNESFDGLNDGAGGGGALTSSAASSVNTITLGVSNGNGAFSGVIASGLGITKSGTGTQVFSGANTYTGATTINGGTLSVSAINNGGVAGNLGQAGSASSNLVLGGGALQYTGATASTNRGFTLSGAGGTVDVSTAGSRLTVSGVVTGSGTTLTKEGAGTLVLSGATNNFTGATLVSNGTLEVAANDALGTNANGTTVANGAALKLNNVNYATAETLSITGTGVGGTGALANTGTSTYAGQINVLAGLTGGATIHAGGGTLTLTGGLVKDGTTLTLAGGGTINVNSAISGASANSDLVVSGTAANLNFANTYNGPTYIRSGGILTAAVADALPTGTRTAVIMDDSGSGSSQLVLLGFAQQAASLTGAATSSVALGSTLTVGASAGTTTFAGTLAGIGGLTKDGASTQILSGASTYTGATAVNNGTLLVNGTHNAGTGAYSVTKGANPSATLGGTGTITTTGAFDVLGDGQITGGTVGTIGTLNIAGAGSRALSGTYLFDVNYGAQSGDLLNFTSATSLTLNATLSLNSAADALPAAGSHYAIKILQSDIAAAGYAAGQSNYIGTVTGLQTYQSIVTWDGGKTFYLVPEPASFALLGLGSLLLLRRPSRRRRATV